MKLSFLKEKGFSSLFLVLFLLLMGGSYVGTQLKINQITRQKIPGSSVIYIPSGKYLKYASFGYSSFLADLIYIWAIQYYSTYTISAAERYKYLDHIFSIISELDPLYLDPYDIGALIAVYEAQNPELGFKILERGLEKNPEQWIFPFEAGHYAHLVKKDYRIAQHYYKIAMEIEGAPPQIKRLYANAAFKAMDFQTSWQTWLEVYNTAEDERTKKIASDHLYQVKAGLDTKMIEEAIQEYKARYDHNPLKLDQLVRVGFLKSLPKDFDGKDYLYDSQTGEVKAPTIPWKR